MEAIFLNLPSIALLNFLFDISMKRSPGRRYLMPLPSCRANDWSTFVDYHGTLANDWSIFVEYHGNFGKLLGKRGLLEKGSFQKCPSSRSSREV